MDEATQRAGNISDVDPATAKPDRLITALDKATGLAKKFGGYVVALGVVLTNLIALWAHFSGLSEAHRTEAIVLFAIVVSIPILVIIAATILPLWLERRRTRWLVDASQIKFMGPERFPLRPLGEADSSFDRP